MLQHTTLTLLSQLPATKKSWGIEGGEKAMH